MLPVTIIFVIHSVPVKSKTLSKVVVIDKLYLYKFYVLLKYELKWDSTVV